MSRTIVITVDRHGRTTVETRGFAGSSCRDASRDLERALGAAVADRPTAESYLREPAAEPPLGQSP